MIEKLLTLFAAPPPGCEHKFLTLVTWYHYLPDEDFVWGSDPSRNACDFTNKFSLNLIPSGGQSHIPLILAAIVDDLLQIAGLVALGFVIVGAIKYISSQGNPESTSNAQSTIINALVGLAIAVTGIAFVNFIGTHVGQ